MIYAFGDFELDGAKRELRAAGAVLPVEPQVFDVLWFLIENRDRAVPKQDLVDAVWDGRAISDSALTSRIKSARKALGDDGAAQKVIRTIHGVGFRFVAEVKAPAAAKVIEAVTPEIPLAQSIRPSIAVFPFRVAPDVAQPQFFGDALPHDVIVQLSRLRWLFVIARASSFRFGAETLDLESVINTLGVRYGLTGSVEKDGDRQRVLVELWDSRDKGVIWSDAFRMATGGVHEVREEIVRAIVSALELQIPLHEARQARLLAPADMDAWSAFHLGVQHVYRFTKTDNDLAKALFQRAVEKDSNFARAYAGLSFAHFQDAFLKYVDDTAGAAQRARICAELCLERDDLEPFGALTKGRAFWLDGDLEGAMPWLDRAAQLNPNYAQAKYSRAWTESLLGLGAESQSHADAAMAQSPLDPLLYAMLATRAFSHLVRDQAEAAAVWGDRAARSPGAHAFIDLVAMVAHAANGDEAKARKWAGSARQRNPALTSQAFFQAFPFRDALTRDKIGAALRRHGF